MRCITYTAVLLLCCTLACIASVEHRCIFDELARKNNIPKSFVVQEVSRQRNSSGGQVMIANNENWESLRIGYFTHDMDNPAKYCTAVGDVRPDLRGGILTCTQSELLTPERKFQLVQQVIPRGVQMHTDRLKVKRLTKNLVVERIASPCAHFMVPSAHMTVGIPNVDTVLYIAAAPMIPLIDAWSLICELQKVVGRPSAGAMNLSPRILAFPMDRARTVAHEITHILGFDIIMFEKYASVKKIFDVRGKPSATVVASPKTVEMTRAYFGCPHLEGMELEDEGGEATVLSHWKRRNAKDELMSAIGSARRYTALTMAVFEDLKFYKAVWEKAEPMTWGRGAGCWFLNEKCVKDGVSQFPSMFCASKRQFPMCTSDRYGLGFCNVKVHDKDLPIYFRYFRDPKVGGSAVSLMDYCPIIQPQTGSACFVGDSNVIPGSRISDNSRCVMGLNLVYNGRAVGDICVEISCERNPLMVRFAGNEGWYNCPEGALMNPPSPFSGGSIVCPLHDEVCIGLDNVLDGTTTTTKPPTPATTRPPTPATTKPPKPATTKPPKPATTKPPKPATTKRPKPATTKRPKPATTKRPKR